MPAPTIPPPIMASAAFCRASPARRTRARPGRGLTADDCAAILATATLPRRTGRGRESETAAAERGAVDKAIVSLLFQGGLRRSEAVVLRWADVQDATDGRGMLIYVRRSKTDQDGTAADVRYLKNGCAVALRQFRDRITVQRSGLRPDATRRQAAGLLQRATSRGRGRPHTSLTAPAVPLRSPSVALQVSATSTSTIAAPRLCQLPAARSRQPGHGRHSQPRRNLLSRPLLQPPTDSGQPTSHLQPPSLRSPPARIPTLPPVLLGRPHLPLQRILRRTEQRRLPRRPGHGQLPTTVLRLCCTPPPPPVRTDSVRLNTACSAASHARGTPQPRPGSTARSCASGSDRRTWRTSDPQPHPYHHHCHRATGARRTGRRRVSPGRQDNRCRVRFYRAQTSRNPTATQLLDLSSVLNSRKAHQNRHLFLRRPLGCSEAV